MDQQQDRNEQLNHEQTEHSGANARSDAQFGTCHRGLSRPVPSECLTQHAELSDAGLSYGADPSPVVGTDGQLRMSYREQDMQQTNLSRRAPTASQPSAIPSPEEHSVSEVVSSSTRSSSDRWRRLAVAVLLTGSSLALAIEESSLALMVLLPIAVAARSGGGTSTRRTVVSSRKVLLVGNNRRTQEHLESFADSPNGAVTIVGVLDVRRDDKVAADGGSGSDSANGPNGVAQSIHVPDLGSVDDLSKVLRQHQVDEVLVTLPIKSCYDEIQAALKTCEEAGVAISLCSKLFESSIARPAVKSQANSSITYSCVPYPAWQLRMKRALDICGALVGIAIFGIPMLLITLAIKLTSKGPVLFRQKRAGINHRTFDIFKFRTMVVDAEDRKEELAELNEVDGPVFKIRKDPRVTRLGSFLRKYSLDELPQFFNVLFGDMSLVGPRPPIPAEVEDYEWWQRRRLSMKPGITCLWQVSGRNDIGFDQWMRLDLAYIDNWSLWLDIKLLFKTVPAVVLGRGAS